MKNIAKKKLQAFAKKSGFNRVKKCGVYKDFDVWVFGNEPVLYTGYPIFALVRNEDVKIIDVYHKLHEEVWDSIKSNKTVTP